MKRLLILLALILVIPSAFALQVTSPTLGGSNAENGEDVSATFTIKNNHEVVITDFKITSNAASKYKITFEDKPSSLGPGASQTVKINGFIPSDFSGKQNIGKITVTASKTDSAAETQNPGLSVPFEMTATNDCGPDVGSSSMNTIGKWHVGSTCNSVDDVEVFDANGDSLGGVDAGWINFNSDNNNEYWIQPIQMTCGGNPQVPPSGWLYGGKVQAGPAVCGDGKNDMPGGDGWTGFFTKPSAPGKLLFVIAEDKCGGSPESVPGNSVILAKVKTGPYKCDGNDEAVSYKGNTIDAGTMYVVFAPIDHNEPEPENDEARGALETLDWTKVKGWAYDPDSSVTSVNVFVDGQFWKDIPADKARPDLVPEKFPEENHGFEYTFTSQDIASLDDTKNHTFTLFAISTPEGTQVPLQGSPKVLLAQNAGNGGNNGGNNGGDNGNDDGNDNGNGGDNGGNNGGSDNKVTATANIFMESARVLEIDRVKVSCDKLETVEEGDKVEVEPGQECLVTVRVENVHDELDLEDIEIELRPENSDIDDDDAHISSLDAGDDEEETLRMFIDDDAEDGRVDVVLHVTADDDDNNRHEVEFTFAVDIEREKNLITVERVIADAVQACEVSRADVRVYVENKGRRDQDEAAVELSVPGLDFRKKLTELFIDEGDEQTYTFSIPIDKNTPFGSFTGTVRTFYENIVESDRETVTVRVTKCPFDDDDAVTSTTSTKTQTRAPPVVVTPPSENVITAPEERQSSTGTSAFYTGLLILLNVIALTVLGVMTAGFVKKYGKKPDEFDAVESDEGKAPRYEDFY